MGESGKGQLPGGVRVSPLVRDWLTPSVRMRSVPR